MPRLTEYMELFGYEIIRAEDRPDWPEIQSWAGDIWRVEDVFTTRDGRWYHEGGVVGSIPDWAIADYDRAAFDDRGGATHLFAAAKENGALLAGAGYWFWSSGLAAIGNHAGAGITQREAKPSGWANISIEHGSGYIPQTGQGAWCMSKFGKSDVLVGLGLPWSWHISTFGVWVRETTVTPPPPPPGGTDLAAVVAGLAQINATLREAFRLGV